MAGAKVPPNMKDRDIQIPEEVGLSEDDQGLTAHELLEELKKDQKRQAQLIEEAEQRERWVLGEQWSPRDPLVETLHTDPYAGDALVTENLLYPLTLTYTARVNEGRVAPRAYPQHPTPEDVGASEASNNVLEYERRRCDEDRLIAEAGQLAQYHGDVLFYPCWVETDGPHRVRRQKVAPIRPGGPEAPVFDEQGQPVYEEAWEHGAIIEEAIAAPDYWTDTQDDYAAAAYVTIRRVISKQLAKLRLEAAALEEASINDKSTLKNPSDLDNRGVETFEVWHKPGARFEHGLYMCFVGGYITKCVPYPYKHGELPGDVWKIGKVRGSPRGKTHVADAIHQQCLVNSALRGILARLQVASSALMVGPDEQVSQVPRSGFKRIPSQLPKSKDVRWVCGDDVPASLFSAYDRARRALYDVFGINEATTTGGDPTETKSGEQLKTAQALDAQKVAPARRNLEHARLRVDRQKLELVRQYWDVARMVRVIGPDGGVQVGYFMGADLEGADVALEAASGILNSRVAGQRSGEESAAAGFVTPQQGAEMRQTGLSETVADSETMVRVDAQGMAALRGQQQQPLPGVPVQPAVQHLRMLLGSPLSMQGDRGALMRLIAAYEQMGQAPPGGAPQQPNQGGGRMQPSSPQPTNGGQPSGVKTTKMLGSLGQPEGIL